MTKWDWLEIFARAIVPLAPAIALVYIAIFWAFATPEILR